MNIPGFTMQTLIEFEFHDMIRECLKKDDENPAAEKVNGVRSFSDWRDFADAVEAELKQRTITLTSINW
jgi:hypothetical protein